jgi:translation initiation factor IF-2
MRVYELAKELRLDNKELMLKLKEMGIEVKSHSSGLDEDQVEKIKGRLVKVFKESIVEQRVMPTVIRRRKKVEVVEPPAREESSSAPVRVKPEALKETPDAGQPDAAAPVSAPEQTSVALRPEEIPPEHAASTRQTAVEEKATAPAPAVKKSKKPKKEVPARIIQRVELTPAVAEEKKRVSPPVAATEKIPAQKIVPVPLTEEQEAAAKGKPKKWKTRRSKETLYDDAELEGLPGPEHLPRKVREVIGVKRKKLQVVPASAFQKKHLAVVEARKPEITVPRAIKRKIRLQEGISVGELARRMGIKVSEVMKKLMGLGLMVTINQLLDMDTATLVAHEFGYEIEQVAIEEEKIFETREDKTEDLQPRCPIVTVMGHVDHGKTSLLDAIKETNVAEAEKGGITQHIGAYKVSTPGGEVVFIDTPGHEAFTAMRARGAQVTDIVVLVVAAEEGAKPQTIEAINHAKAAQVPILVAINKIDKPEANPERVKQALAEYGLVPEEWGGETLYVELSAKKRIGIEKLLESILLQAEIMELKANPGKPAKGIIIEAKVDRGRGPLATVLVQEGTLRMGDSFVSKFNFGKVRALIDDKGKVVQEAGPATPVEVLGFSGVPNAGDIFLVVDEEKKARQASLYWQQKQREETLQKDARVSLESFYSTMKEGAAQELNLIIKADVQGSAEALRKALTDLNTDAVKVVIIHASVGSISLSDVMLASASNAIIIGFNVKTEPKVMEEAEETAVSIRLYGIIYEVIADVEKAMAGMLAPTIIDRLNGKAEIRQVFSVTKVGTIAGCIVSEGKIIKGSLGRLVRNQKVVYEGTITSLKRFKEEAREVLAGQECGIFFGDPKDIQPGDVIECITQEEVATKLR